MHVLVAPGPESERLHGAEAAESSTEANSGQPLDVCVREGVMALTNPSDDAGAHRGGQLVAGEAAAQEISPRCDAAEFINGVQETSHPAIVRLHEDPVCLDPWSVHYSLMCAPVEVGSLGRNSGKTWLRHPSPVLNIQVGSER